MSSSRKPRSSDPAGGVSRRAITPAQAGSQGRRRKPRGLLRVYSKAATASTKRTSEIGLEI